MRVIVAAAAGLVLVLSCVIFLASSPARMNWRKVRTSFKGFTNSRSGEAAMISIRNEGPLPVALRDNFWLEYVGVPPYQPVPGLPNLVRMLPTHTNLVLAPATQTDFWIPRPEMGTSWLARLEFVPAGSWTTMNEKLIRRQDSLTKSLPPVVAGVPVRAVPIYVVTQPFCATN